MFGSVLALPGVQADAAAQQDSILPYDTHCFLMPVPAGADHSPQWCTHAPRGRSIEAMMRDAPAPFQSSFSTLTSVTLGVDYDGSQLTGATFNWWGSTGCTSTISYRGDFSADWNDRTSSAIIDSGSGCHWFRHFDTIGSTGSYYECGLTVQKCDLDQLYINGWDNRASSVRFLY
ncbi:MAG: hypothetical protein QOE90_535 [Thermoplasmata archaeon]|jgi:hypothetical protein|nr:hypothetical protein [Thermoplasmata archaeon]